MIKIDISVFIKKKCCYGRVLLYLLMSESIEK